MSSTHSNYQIENEIIESLIFPVAPERKNELQRLLMNNNIQFWLDSEKEGVTFCEREPIALQ